MVLPIELGAQSKHQGRHSWYQALAPFQKALLDPKTIGRGAEGQTWMCLVDLELLACDLSAASTKG